ncbi:MAG: hypothetical protein GY906_09435 [bacterium]|nr:hypothetical protein [bacterium]
MTDDTPQDAGTPPPPPTQDPPATPPPTEEPPKAGAESPNRTIMIVLAYFGLLALIPLLVEKDDQEVQWHAKHGLVLFVAEVVLFIVFMVVNFALTSVLPVLGCVTCLVPAAFSVAIIVIHILCIVKGVKGERYTLPVVSEYADKF